MRQILSFRLTKLDSYYIMHMDKTHNHYIHDTARESEWKMENEMLESLSEDELKRAKEISWGKIFDIRRTYTIKACRGINVQAAFWEIKREYIRNTWFFKTK